MIPPRLCATKIMGRRSTYENMVIVALDKMGHDSPWKFFAPWLRRTPSFLRDRVGTPLQADPGLACRHHSRKSVFAHAGSSRARGHGAIVFRCLLSMTFQDGRRGHV